MTCKNETLVDCRSSRWPFSSDMRSSLSVARPTFIQPQQLCQGLWTLEPIPSLSAPLGDCGFSPPRRAIPLCAVYMS